MSVEPSGLLTHSFIGLIFAKRRGIHGTLLIHNYDKKQPPRCSNSRWKPRCSSSSSTHHNSRRCCNSRRKARGEQPEHPEQRAMYPRYSVFEYFFISGDKSPVPPAAYAAEGCSQERAAPMLQDAWEAALSKDKSHAPQAAPLEQPPPQSATLMPSVFIQM